MPFFSALAAGRSEARAVRDRMFDRWNRTQQRYYRKDAKRIYYLSAEYLLGRQLPQNLLATGTEEMARQACERHGLRPDDLVALVAVALATIAALFWGGETGMRCLGEVVAQTRAELALKHLDRWYERGMRAAPIGIETLNPAALVRLNKQQKLDSGLVYEVIEPGEGEPVRAARARDHARAHQRADLDVGAIQPQVGRVLAVAAALKVRADHVDRRGHPHALVDG